MLLRPKGALAWFAVAGALGCSQGTRTDAPPPAAKESVASAPPAADPGQTELLFPSMPLVDVSEATLKAEGAEDLIGKMTFTALAEAVGIAMPDGSFKPLFNAGTPVPVARSQVLSTAEDGQQELRLDFFRGEGKRVSDNHHLGGVRITGIPGGKAGGPQIELKLAIEKNGDLHLSARDKKSGALYELKAFGD